MTLNIFITTLARSTKSYSCMSHGVEMDESDGYQMNQLHLFTIYLNTNYVNNYFDVNIIENNCNMINQKYFSVLNI